MKLMKYAVLAVVSMFSAALLASQCPYERGLDELYGKAAVPVAQAAVEVTKSLAEQLLENAERYLDVSAATEAFEASKRAAIEATSWVPFQNNSSKISKRIWAGLSNARNWILSTAPKALGHMSGEVAEITKGLKKAPVVTIICAGLAFYGVYKLCDMFMPTTIKQRIKRVVTRTTVVEEQEQHN